MMHLPPIAPALIATRAERAVRKHGLGGTARLAVRRLKPRPRIAADYLWYRLELAHAGRPRPALPAGLRLRRGGIADLELLLSMPRDGEVTTMTEQVVRSRLAADGTPWLVEYHRQILFSCWTFERKLPVRGERRWRLALPSGVVGLEDSFVLPAFRGRGIASAAWAQIGDRCAEAGCDAVIVKVDVRNAPSRRVAQKAGFSPVARMRIVWRDWRTIVRVTLPADRADHGWLRTIERG